MNSGVVNGISFDVGCSGCTACITVAKVSGGTMDLCASSCTGGSDCFTYVDDGWWMMDGINLLMISILKHHKYFFFFI